MAYPGGQTIPGVDGEWAADDEVVAERGCSLRIHPARGRRFVLYQSFYLYRPPGAAGGLVLDVSLQLRQHGLRGGDPPGLVVLAQEAGAEPMLGVLQLQAAADPDSWQRLSGSLHLVAPAVLVHVIVGAAGSEQDDADARVWFDDVRIAPEPCLAPRQCPLIDPATTPLSREAAVPPGAEKFDPRDDPAPPVLHEEFLYDPERNPGGEWYAPVPLDGPINTAGAEDAAFFAADDDDTLYFYFTPSFLVDPGVQILWPEEGIYRARRTRIGEGWIWSAPEKIWLFDTLAGEGCPFVRGDTLWACAVACGGASDGLSYYTSTRHGGGWGLGRPAGEPYDDPRVGIGEFHLTLDEQGVEWLYFHAERPDGLGSLDLWVIRHDGASWSAPIHLGSSINSPEYEGFPYITPDGLELWFSATTRKPEYHPYGAIFRSRREGWDDRRGVWAWGEPEEIVTRYAGEPTLDAAGSIYFTHHFHDIAQNGLVESDIYVARHK